MVDPFDTIGFEFANFLGRDGAATAAKYPDMTCPRVAQHVDHVAEIFRVPALVGADGDPVRVFLDGRAHDIGDRAIVPEVNHFGPFRLDQAAHHVDRGVVAVKQ